MAIPPPKTLNQDWVREAFLRDFTEATFFPLTDMFRPRLPTVESIRADVAKLHSVSATGRAWIEDRRMAIASVGPWKNTFVIPEKGGRYPAIITKARQQGVTYTTQLRAAD